MTLSIGIYNFCGHYLSVLYFINLKLFRMTKMLEHLAIIIGYCNLHSHISLSLGFLSVHFQRYTVVAQTTAWILAQRIIPAFNFQRCPFRQKVRTILESFPLPP